MLVLVITARIAAPFVIKEVLNRKLADLPEYRGSIDDVDLAVKVVADVDVTEPVMNVMPEATQKRKPKDQIKKDEEGQAITETVKTLLPTKINHLHIHEGAVRFKTAPPTHRLVLHRAAGQERRDQRLLQAAPPQPPGARHQGW